MTETTDIEKKSLEAHVELCAERYKALDRQFDSVKEDISDIKSCIQDIKSRLADINERRNTQLITWGIGIIGSLAATIAWLLAKYVLI